MEIKRRSDSRLTGARREVVGQMLDYAANAVVYWPVEKLRAVFSSRHPQTEDAQRRLEQLIGTPLDDAAVDEFWNRAGTNLQAGRIRLIFVADHIPLELRRIIEFLNKHMSPVEVLGVEIRHFAGEDAGGHPIKTLVPHVIGLIAPPTGPRPSEIWNLTKFLQAIEVNSSPEEATVAHAIFNWADSKSHPVWWGRGNQEGAFHLGFLSVYSHSGVCLPFGNLKTKAPFDDEARRLELLNRINALPGIAIAAKSLTGYPSIPFAKFCEVTTLSQFLEIMDWVVNELTRNKV